jgi:hypothetical protein
MSQPPTYARQYSFLAYQVSNPEDPLPGQKVDQELNAVKVTLDAILTNIALIQRDDGRLANNSVGTSQLDGALISLGFERPTSWATTTAYAVDDAVFQDNKLYICLIAHTSGTFATDLAALKWEEVIDFTTLVTDAEAARDEAETYAAAALASKNSAATYAADIFGGVDRFYGSTTGTDNYTVATQDYQPGVRESGFEAWFYVVNANGGPVNITIGGYADDDVKNNDGSELVSGEWPAGSLQGVKWHDTLGYYIWLNNANPVKYARLLSNNTFTGVQTFSGVVNFDAAVDFDAAAVFDSTVALNGAVTAASTLTANGASTFNETVTINDDVVIPETALVDAATIAWDMSTGTNFNVVLGGNRTLGAPTNQAVGQAGELRVVQDGTGNRTLAFDAIFAFPGAVTETTEPSAGSHATYKYVVRSVGSRIELKRIYNAARPSIGFYKEYTLANPYAVSTDYTQAHGLGRKPAKVEVFLRCVTATDGWSIGDDMLTGTNCYARTGTTIAYTTRVTDTEVIVYTSASLPTHIGSANSEITITAAEWALMARVYE